VSATHAPRAAVYFVASPLHLLAARRVALDHEAGARQVLVCYRPSLAPLLRHDEWDAVVTMPWPRFDPLPGLLGRQRRMLDNLERVAAATGRCDALRLHSPVFDTEAINYFVRALPRMTGAAEMRARILPDGLLNVQRYPLSAAKRAAQWLRKARRLLDRRLDYARFAGDRIGSDAPFVDRIYVLHGFPHAYDPAKVVTLRPLVDAVAADVAAPRRALVLGQPLSGIGAMSDADIAATRDTIAAWIAAQGIDEVDYQPHPREGGTGDLRAPHYRALALDRPVELHMAAHPYAALAGCCSTALFLARQIYGERVRIAGAGVECFRFESDEKRRNTLRLMDAFGIERPQPNSSS
jgi:hypothetical protein